MLRPSILAREQQFNDDPHLFIPIHLNFRLLRLRSMFLIVGSFCRTTAPTANKTLRTKNHPTIGFVLGEDFSTGTRAASRTLIRGIFFISSIFAISICFFNSMNIVELISTSRSRRPCSSNSCGESTTLRFFSRKLRRAFSAIRKDCSTSCSLCSMNSR